ncbi:MAG TPA: SWIM zinc finger family protein [Pirellulales bacterium]
MAEYGPLLTRLRDALAALDDDALAALANKGLLRRARKDLEQLPAEILPERPDTGDSIQVRVGGENVTVPANPLQADCTCPAAGICRHVLGALVFLREASAASIATPASPAEAAVDPLDGLDDDALRRWSGKPLLRRATKALTEGLKVELDAGGLLVARFPSWNISCRLVPGAGLAGLICSCQSPDVCVHRVAAVLAWQVARGSRTIAVAEAILPAAAETPRSREEVLASVRAVLTEMLSVGLARLSAASGQRLQTLAVSCHGVQLPRLERWLTVLAEHVARALRRDAQSSAAALLEWSARVAALAAALAAPKPGLVGRHRTSYEQVGHLSLAGLGAERWLKAGYAGLTVFFWDESLGNWCSWSDARPLNVWAFDPQRRYNEYGPWDGCPSPKLASHSRLQLTAAWRNPAGRLSGRARTSATLIGESDPRQVPGSGDWSQIGAQARRLFGGGLAERNEQDELVLLRPTLWLPGQYDELRQELVRLVLDEQQRPLPLVLPFTAETASAVRILEQHDAAGTIGVLGRLQLGGGKLSVKPISLWREGGVINLTLDAAVSASPAAANSPLQSPPAAAVREQEESPLDEPPMDEVFIAGTTTPLGVFLSGIEAELERVAESGTSVRRDVQPLEQAAARLEGLGLEAVAAAVAALVTKLRVAPQAIDVGERAAAAVALLRAAYVLRLAIVEETLAVATAGIT